MPSQSIRKRIEKNKLAAAIGCLIALGGIAYYLLKDTEFIQNIIQELSSDQNTSEGVGSKKEKTRDNEEESSSILELDSDSTANSLVFDSSDSAISRDITLSRVIVERKPRLILSAIKLLYQIEHINGVDTVIFNPRFEQMVRKLQKKYEILFLARVLNPNQQKLIEQALEKNWISDSFDIVNSIEEEFVNKDLEYSMLEDSNIVQFRQESGLTQKTDNLDSSKSLDATLEKRGILINSENVLFYSTTEGKYNIVKHLAIENPPRPLYNEFSIYGTSPLYECNKLVAVIDSDFEFLEELQPIIPLLVHVNATESLNTDDQLGHHRETGRLKDIKIADTTDDIFKFL